jgi:replicative DNA helicase
VLAQVYSKLHNHTKPILYDAGFGPGILGLAPHRITTLAGEAGVGKSSLAMACMFETLANHPGLRAAVANVEVSDEELLQREFARQSGIPFDKIFHADLTPEEDALLEEVREDMLPILDRVAFLSEPFSPYCLEEGMRWAEADLLVVDYLQQLHRPNGMGPRDAVEESIAGLRGLAKQGKCILAISQVSRPQAGGGRRGLDSLSESRQIGYDSTNVYTLKGLKAQGGFNRVELQHNKSRSGPMENLTLLWDAPRHDWKLSPKVKAAA